MDFKKYGKQTGRIPVIINYRVIELFSAGLYSSPNKAFEELVSNSYDAYADKVCVYVPEEINAKSVIVVCDNGNSMNAEELKQLWNIGRSHKRDKPSQGRQPIGKFGIGKLATYVLAKKLTYICKKEGKIKSVTMDYGSIPKKYHEETIFLDELDIDETQAMKLISDINLDLSKINFTLFGENAQETWTIAILSNIRDEGKSIKHGMLKWILRTALPINPGFNLMFNDEPIVPSKQTGKIIKEWVFGKEDEIIERENYVSREEAGKYYVDLPHLKGINGSMTLYEQTLSGGKAEKWGHSYGVFLMVRGRLINTDNPLLNGMKELNHATFNRIRIEIHADELDDKLTSTRESIKDSIEYKELVDYIKKKFYKAKGVLDEWIDNQNREVDFSEKLLNTTPFYSKVPISVVAKRFYDGEISAPYLIKFPSEGDFSSKEIIEQLNNSITDPEDKIIEDYSLNNNLKTDDPIVNFDVITKNIQINTHHPFYITFLSELKGNTNLPFSLVAVNEIFTEASLIEKNVDEVIVRQIMDRRDKVFREMSRNKEPDIFTASLMLKNSLDDEDGLEEALHYCFKCLGFRVEPMAKTGEPEGIAYAKLGMWDGKSQDYSFTYEAKSTGKSKISADTAKTGVVDLHRKKYGATYAIEVSIDFAGAMDSDSNVNQLAKSNNVTLVRAKDFWTLLINAIPNQLSFQEFEDLLKNCHTVIETSEWIQKFIDKKIEKKPYMTILEGIQEIIDIDAKEPPSISAIRHRKNLLHYSDDEIREMITTMRLISPNLIYLEDDKVRILLPPNKLLEIINKTIEDQSPSAEMKDKLRKAFENNLNKN